jgi:uncharacterized membrane protein YkgB
MSTNAAPQANSLGASCVRYGGLMIRYGLVVPIVWIGVAKFTSGEANAIMPLIANQPLMSWVYKIQNIQEVSNVIGVIEITAAVLIASKPFAPRLSAAGSAIAIVLFASTVSFLFTTPAVVDNHSYALPLLTDTGGFLIKDLVLLGASVWTLGDALLASTRVSRLDSN